MVDRIVFIGFMGLIFHVKKVDDRSVVEYSKEMWVNSTVNMP